MKEKLSQVERSRNYITFFNPNSLRLMSKTPADILCELGVRAFSGSRDVPKDIVKAYGLFAAADLNSDDK
jgi:hypothetical protein